MMHVKRQRYTGKSIATLYVFFVVNTERNKSASLTNTCEQLKEQLDQAHSKVEPICITFSNSIPFSDVCRFLHLKETVMIIGNILNSSKRKAFSVTSSARKKVKF